MADAEVPRDAVTAVLDRFGASHYANPDYAMAAEIVRLTQELEQRRADSERIEKIPELLLLDEGDGRDWGALMISREWKTGDPLFQAYEEGGWHRYEDFRVAIDRARGIR